MKKRQKQEYKELVTKEKLSEYIKNYGVIEVVPLKDEEPLLILKLTEERLIGLGYPQKIVIHKGYFILTSSVKCIPSGSKSIVCYVGADVKYLQKFQKSYHSKELFIRDVLDNEITMSSTRYIRPVRNFFREYGIMEEKRGKCKKINENIKERNQFIIDVYESLKNKIPLPIQTIQQKLGEKIEKDGNPKYNIHDATVRRIIKKHISIKKRTF